MDRKKIPSLNQSSSDKDYYQNRDTTSTSILKFESKEVVEQTKIIGTSLPPDPLKKERSSFDVDDSTVDVSVQSQLPPLLTEEGRIETARLAMEEYMKKDDGGTDWLQMMNQIMEEEEDNDIALDSTDVKHVSKLGSSERKDKTPETNRI
jgi:hypothetical protein